MTRRTPPQAPDASPAVTAWYDGRQKPAHEGPYRRRGTGAPFSCWNGRTWMGDAATAAAAARKALPSPHQSLAWQGLAAPSELPCLTCRGHGVADAGDDDTEGWPQVRPCPDC